MSPGAALALVLLALTSVFGIVNVIELSRDWAYLGGTAVAGRMVLIVALMALSGVLARIVAREPTASSEPAGLSPLDIGDDPPNNA
jgi:hypothetical protein